MINFIVRLGWAFHVSAFILLYVAMVIAAGWTVWNIVRVIRRQRTVRKICVFNYIDLSTLFPLYTLLSLWVLAWFFTIFNSTECHGGYNLLDACLGEITWSPWVEQMGFYRKSVEYFGYMVAAPVWFVVLWKSGALLLNVCGRVRLFLARFVSK